MINVTLGAPPFSDVGIIAVALGLFFILVAAYKSIFHRRRIPPEKMIDSLLEGDTQKQHNGTADNQPVKVQDPFRTLATPPPAALPPPPPTTTSAFKFFTANSKVNPNTPSTETTYVWE